MEKKVNILLYRNLGINNGRGYQPYYIYKYSKSVIKNLYLMKNNTGYKEKNLFFMPLFLYYLIHVISKIYTSLFKKSNISEFYLLSKFYDFYLRTVISYKEEYYIFGYIPSLAFLKKLKNKNKKLILYVGSSHPLHTYNVTKEEFAKLNIELPQIMEIQNMSEYETIVNSFDSLITTSNYCSKNWKKYGFKGKIYTCPLGVDFSYFNSKNNEKKRKEKKIFLYTGRISCLKGVNYLLDAWKDLDLKDSKLLLVGDKKKAEWDYFGPIIENMDNVEFIGYQKDMTKIYNESLVFIFPSLMEGYGKVVTEAMACGLPIIGTPCVQHAFKNNKEGIYIDYRNTEQIKFAIKYYYDNPEEAVKVGFNAKKNIKSKSWDNFGKNFKNIVLEIIK